MHQLEPTCLHGLATTERGCWHAHVEALSRTRTTFVPSLADTKKKGILCFVANAKLLFVTDGSVSILFATRIVGQPGWKDCSSFHHLSRFLYVTLRVQSKTCKGHFGYVSTLAI